jgi:two-component sensor histidine kinase
MTLNEAMYIHYLRKLTDSMIRENKAAQALVFAAKSIARLKTLADDQQLNVADIYGSCYLALGKYKKAEPYIGQMKELFYKLEKSRRYANKPMWVYYYGKIIDFYILCKQYKKAEFYLKEANDIPESAFTTLNRSAFQLYYFKVDSAASRNISAIKHYELYKTFADSVSNAEKVKKINELDIKYKAGQKDWSIAELKLKNVAQNASIEQTRFQRNITFAGITAFMIISGLAYNGYRNKKRSNWILETKQTELNSQNSNLQSLLIEKDWLLKEVHHRVKNNLQIVMSLLSSQSTYLENTAAIEAIRESQNRVQAISLIHQKLYKSNNVASINMPAYVADLLEYLADSFDTRKRYITFEQIIEPFNLDLGQAVPIGLILNESVTNAIKYAFGDKGGQIIIALQLIKDETLLLTIADDGKGFPATFDPQNTTTLGMEMMKALSKQLGGEFKITNNFGVRISIEFQIEKILSGLPDRNL